MSWCLEAILNYHDLGMLIGFVFCSVGKATVILCVDEYDQYVCVLSKLYESKELGEC